jgi:hypothetical protein
VEVVVEVLIKVVELVLEGIEIHLVLNHQEEVVLLKQL